MVVPVVVPSLLPLPRESAILGPMTTSSLARLVHSRSKQYGPKTALRVLKGGDEFELSWIDLWRGAVSVATLLVREGLPRERSVAIVAPFSADALIAEIGVIVAAGVACPLQPPLDEATLDRFLAETNPWLVLASPDVMPDLLRAVERVGNPVRCLPLAQVEPGDATLQEVPDEVAARIQGSGPETPALSLPTAGVSRPVQRVDLTNRNLCATGMALARALVGDEEDVWMSLRPSTRPFLRVAGCYAGLLAGGEVAIFDDASIPDAAESNLSVMEHVWRVQPTVLVCLEDELASLGEWALREAGSMVGFDGFLVRSVLRAGGVIEAVGASLIVARLFAPAGMQRARAMFGGRLRVVLSGMGPVDSKARGVFGAMGIDVRGSYGVAEASGLVTLESAGSAGRPGNVGFPLEGVRVAIAEDGEIRVSGYNVMLSYRQVAPLDNEMLLGEWLRTQDVGRLEPDGSLVLSGRLKPETPPGE